MFMCLILFDDIIWARRIVTRLTAHKSKSFKPVLWNAAISIFFFAERSHFIWILGSKEKYHYTCKSSFLMLENKNNSCEFKW